MDNDHDESISFKEFNVTGPTIDKLCEDLVYFDKEGWMERTRPPNNNKTKFFELVDQDGDGKVSETEFKEFYKQIDRNGDFKVHSDEV